MKILFDALPMLADNKSGVGYYSKELVENIAKYHSDSVSLFGYYFNFLGKKRVDNNDRNISLKPIKYIPGKLLSLMRDIGIKPNINLFINCDYNFYIFTNYVAMQNTKKVPFASIIYDLSYIDCPEYVQEKNLKFLHKNVPWTIINSSLIITISEFTKNRILANYKNIDKKNILVTPIPPVISSQKKLKINDRLKGLGIKPKGYILYLGTLEPRKNIVNLIKAYGLLNEEYRDIYSLVLAGGKGWKDGEIINSIYNAKQNGQKVIATGYIDDDEKIALYQNAKMFVLPSHYEGFGMPILEAMAYSVPVTVSDIEVFHEVAGDSALYFDKDNPDDIACKIAKIINDNSLSKTLINKGLKNLDNFSWHKVADDVYKAIDQLINPK